MHRVGRTVVPRWEVRGAPRSVGIVSEATASGGDLRRIPICDAHAPITTEIVWRSAPSPAARAFLDHLRA